MRDSDRVRVEPGQPDQHRARGRARTEVLDHLDALGAGADPLGGEGAQQLLEQQRVAAGGLVAGGAEGVGRSLAEPVAHDRRDRRGCQRVRLDRRGERVVGDLRQQGRVGPRVGGAQRRRDQHLDALEAAGEIRDEAQGGRVRPVQVVYREQQRPALGEVDGEPVEAVERREGGVAAGPLLGGGEDDLGRGGRAPEQLPSLRLARQQRLEELARDAERELPLDLAAPGGEHEEALRFGAPAQLSQQPALAYARGPLDQRQPRAAVARLLDQRVDRG